MMAPKTGRERDAALLSLDPAKIIAYARTRGIVMPSPDDPNFWIGVHKARTAHRLLPVVERRKSMEWLGALGLRHLAYDLDPTGRGLSQ